MADRKDLWPLKGDDYDFVFAVETVITNQEGKLLTN